MPLPRSSSLKQSFERPWPKVRRCSFKAKILKKELFRHFPIEDFSWINDIFPEEDEGEEGMTEDNPHNPASIVNDESMLEAREGDGEVLGMIFYEFVSTIQCPDGLVALFSGSNTRIVVWQNLSCDLA